jgi:N-glycosylase/DNA lyase
VASVAGNRTSTRSFSLSAPSEFNFHRTVLSHGWYDLPPFRWDAATGYLWRPLRLPGAGAAIARVRFLARGGVGSIESRIVANAPITPGDLKTARRDIAHIFRLDENLGSFYRRADEVRRPDLRWTGSVGAGRLLRSPDVFEDLVKMICTTNCSWSLTRVMVTALVDRLGLEAPEGGRLFPDAAAMAGRPERFYRDVVRAGYRASSLRGLARRVAGGGLDLVSWNDPARPTPGIREEILSIDGAGPYVADNMLKLLGRYDGLGIDSWCRRKFSGMYHKGRAVKDRRIESFYEPFGAWRGLALWCDITRDWFEGDKAVVGVTEKLTAATY